MDDLGFEPSMPEATVLQTAEVTNASRHPNSGREYRTRTYACRNQNPMPYQLGELPTVTLIVLSALFAMLMRDGLELPQLYT